MFSVNFNINCCVIAKLFFSFLFPSFVLGVIVTRKYSRNPMVSFQKAPRTVHRESECCPARLSLSCFQRRGNSEVPESCKTCCSIEGSCNSFYFLVYLYFSQSRRKTRGCFEAMHHYLKFSLSLHI